MSCLRSDFLLSGLELRTSIQNALSEARSHAFVIRLGPGDSARTTRLERAVRQRVANKKEMKLDIELIMFLRFNSSVSVRIYDGNFFSWF